MARPRGRAPIELHLLPSPRRPDGRHRKRTPPAHESHCHGQQVPAESSATPSTRRQLDGVATRSPDSLIALRAGQPWSVEPRANAYEDVTHHARPRINSGEHVSPSSAGAHRRRQTTLGASTSSSVRAAAARRITMWAIFASGRLPMHVIGPLRVTPHGTPTAHCPCSRPLTAPPIVRQPAATRTILVRTFCAHRYLRSAWYGFVRPDQPLRVHRTVPVCMHCLTFECFVRVRARLAAGVSTACPFLLEALHISTCRPKAGCRSAQEEPRRTRTARTGPGRRRARTTSTSARPAPTPQGARLRVRRGPAPLVLRVIRSREAACVCRARPA